MRQSFVVRPSSKETMGNGDLCLKIIETKIDSYIRKLRVDGYESRNPLIVPICGYFKITIELPDYDNYAINGFMKKFRGSGLSVTEE